MTLWCRSEESSGNIYEKYNCTGAGRPGGGGEYDVQVRIFSVGNVECFLAMLNKKSASWPMATTA